ncbi:MAG TPA: tRNA (adenosine(37)-N6)-threonylcarbamoyltransferase complex ATPase subunit type 1 TsaE [Aquabacterium sp.]|uniref:tRNA (adenosine(37)-N6)-threonylcarbamoyltransferase complex ATPase subunit type 1 TsaE n=1 Tax=Aquabacterium sp. TaxID=1872578 RepID=UPI002E3252B4|nr:tRNA (adenosine(37)-N6)-threonylcarbamoyltransferase complex ATPase subunit type 1 TsaE [Aquabacterium sp.]HEX5371141.1 tRNA (adenosine(37)-N6)-threonylcarbamoyltransferase complex ATPase subunit type 1 TsaE [Aquabacterium sp.]
MHVTIVARAQTDLAPPASPAPVSGRGAVSRLCWPDEAGCANSAQALARLMAPALRHGSSVLIELRGTLGAGKTTFTRHLLRALGVQGRIKSPSYAVVESYDVEGLQVWHFDFYRFADPREWEDAGFRDIFSGPGLKLVEWPDKAAGLLPAADICLDIDTDTDDRRLVNCHSETEAGCALVQAWVNHPAAQGDAPRLQEAS